MANVQQMTGALKDQLYTFLKYVNENYTTTPTDVDESLLWYIEPFDASNEENLKTLIGVNDYGVVISDVFCESTQPHATGYLRFEYTATIYILRRTLQSKDLTNKTNIILQGGTDDGGNTVTSMDRICGDIAKWFNDYTRGGKLANESGTEMAFRCDIGDVSNLSNTGSFYWKTLSFRALSMESNTISLS